MKVTLIQSDPMTSMYEAAGVCRDSANATTALEHSIRDGHDSILEQASVTYKIEEISRCCSHQLVRHRIASYAQQSQRHITLTYDKDWFVRPPSVPIAAFNTCMDYLVDNYRYLIEEGVSEEDARYVLPNACKTNLVMNINLRSLINFFEHRICSRAQWEIQTLAIEMHKLIKHLYPVVFKYHSFPACLKCSEPCKGGFNGDLFEV